MYPNRTFACWRLRSKRTNNNAKLFSFLDKPKKYLINERGMESREQLKEKDLKEKRLTKRLHLATTRIKDVERERIWAIANSPVK